MKKFKAECPRCGEKFKYSYIDINPYFGVYGVDCPRCKLKVIHSEDNQK